MRLADEDRIDVLEYRSDMLEDALARFMETTEAFIRESREARERSEKAEREFREWMKKSDRESKVLREESEKADRELQERISNSEKELQERISNSEKELQERISNSEKELQERISKSEKELQERISKADRELRREINRSHGELINRLGTLAEDMVVPGIPGIARQYFGVPQLDFLTVRARKKSLSDPSRTREFDGLAVSENCFFLNETKSNPKPEYAREFVESLAEIGDFFPEYAQKKFVPIFSSLYIPDDVVKYLSRHGVYAMGMKDDAMDLLNFEEVAGK